jgi:hypothetical protein
LQLPLEKPPRAKRQCNYGGKVRVWSYKFSLTFEDAVYVFIYLFGYFFTNTILHIGRAKVKDNTAYANKNQKSKTNPLAQLTYFKKAVIL